jgi:hypothetical protein
VQSIYDDTEASVHELITCGGLQIRIASDIVIMLLASNEDLFKQEERALISGITSNPFSQANDGVWTMPITSSSDSSFDLSFYDPATGDRIAEDVFDLDSFLVGVHIQTDLGLAEMAQHPSDKHAFRFTWDADGPLAHLMNDGEPLPDGFELQLSLTDFLSASPADFGPFASVFEIEADSVVHYVDSSGTTDVSYHVRTLRDSLASIAQSASLDFEVESIQSRDRELLLSGNSDDLRIVRIGELAGRIEYSLSGKVDSRSVAIDVESDFGSGEAYPTTKWSCR